MTRLDSIDGLDAGVSSDAGNGSDEFEHDADRRAFLAFQTEYDRRANAADPSPAGSTSVFGVQRVTPAAVYQYSAAQAHGVAFANAAVDTPYVLNREQGLFTSPKGVIKPVDEINSLPELMANMRLQYKKMLESPVSVTGNDPTLGNDDDTDSEDHPGDYDDGEDDDITDENDRVIDNADEEQDDICEEYYDDPDDADLEGDEDEEGDDEDGDDDEDEEDEGTDEDDAEDGNEPLAQSVQDGSRPAVEEILRLDIDVRDAHLRFWPKNENTPSFYEPFPSPSDAAPVFSVNLSKLDQDILPPPPLEVSELVLESSVPAEAYAPIARLLPPPILAAPSYPAMAIAPPAPNYGTRVLVS